MHRYLFFFFALLLPTVALEPRLCLQHAPAQRGAGRRSLCMCCFSCFYRASSLPHAFPFFFFVANTYMIATRHRLYACFQINEHGNITKKEMYNEYEYLCIRLGILPSRDNILGKYLSQTFPTLTARRLGPITAQVGIPCCTPAWQRG